MDLVTALNDIVSTEQVQVFGSVYDEIVSHEEGLTKEELCKQTFGLEAGYFSDRIFELFDTNHSGRVDRDQFILGLSGLISRDQEEFVEFLFDVFDEDGSGDIDREELYQGMLASLRANKLSLAHRIEDFFDGKANRHESSEEQRARELADEVFAAVGQKESIAKDEFKRVYLAHMAEWGEVASPLTKARITTREFQQFIKSGDHVKENPYKLRKRPWYKQAQLYIIQNPRRVFWFTMWIVVNLALFLWKFLYYHFGRPEVFELLGYCICFARGSAECLKFNIAIVLLTMCRRFLTYIRNLFNGEALEYINLDDNVATHKLVGISILLLTLIHTSAHICDFHLIGQATFDEVNDALGTVFTNVTKPSAVSLWFGSLQGITGLCMLLCMVIAYPGVLERVRRNGHFNLFWGTHQLLIVMTLLVMVHGLESLLEPFTAVYWIAIPFILYIIDRIQKSTVILPPTKTTVLAPGKALPPNVMELKLNRKNFPNYKAGQYVFLNVPKISLFEWHPFTLTSAPEDNYLSVHVRSVGGWTNAFHQVYLENGDAKDEESLQKPLGDFPPIYVDGPYGSPSQAYERYKVCMFVAGGIGITPYAAILSHILNQVRDIRRRSSVGENIHISSLPVKKIYLFWATRDEASVAWFDKLLQDFYELDVSEMIEIHHYYTEAFEKGDLQNSLIGLAHTIQGVRREQELDGKLFNLNRHRYYSHYGRPNWDIVFNGIKKTCKSIDGECGVFATVPPRFGAILRRAARNHSDNEFKFEYTAENF